MTTRARLTTLALATALVIAPACASDSEDEPEPLRVIACRSAEMGSTMDVASDVHVLVDPDLAPIVDLVLGGGTGKSERARRRLRARPRRRRCAQDHRRRRGPPERSRRRVVRAPRRARHPVLPPDAFDVERLTGAYDNPTFYPFGYLRQAHTQCLWRRRDEFARLIIEEDVLDSTSDVPRCLE